MRSLACAWAIALKQKMYFSWLHLSKFAAGSVLHRKITGNGLRTGYEINKQVLSLGIFSKTLQITLEKFALKTTVFKQVKLS